MTTQSAGNVNRRKKLLVDRPVQFHFIRLLAFVVLAVMVAFIIVERGGGHGPGIGPVQMLVTLLLATILILIGVIYFGLRFSNKIVGPIYAFGRNLQQVQQGDYTGELHLRHGDEFQNLSGVFNLTVEALRQRIYDDVAFYNKLIGEVQALGGLDQRAKDELVRLIQEQRAVKERYVTKA